MKAPQKFIFYGISAALLAVFLLSSFAVCTQWQQAKKSERCFDELEELVTSHTPQTISAYEQYDELLAQNPDFVGWVSIEGTAISYPVMQSQDRPNHYLSHGFDGEASAYGVPYVDERCRIGQSENTTIYGHSMKNGSMFYALLQYENEAYYHAHPTIQFDTLSGYGEYAILAVFVIDISVGDFYYTNYIDMNRAQFDEFMAYLNAYALYNTNVEAHYGDVLLTLSTCAYTSENGRFVVVAKKL